MNKNSRLVKGKRRQSMQSKKGGRALCLALASTLALTACGTQSEQAGAVPSAITPENQEQVLEQVLGAQISPSHSSQAGKEETVYVLADARGSVSQVIVSDWLKNGDGGSSLSDCTDLVDIENVKGYETFEEDGKGNLTWKAQGADIYYRGNSDKELPVEVRLSYQLDGKDITPQELAGKSGRVTIRMDYINKEKRMVEIGGKKQEIKVPFAMISGMVLPQDTFSNIEVTNARLLSEGSNSVVIGIAFPGLKESIDLEDLKDRMEEDKREELQKMELPEYIEISADTENFQLGMTMTVAMSDVLSEISLTDSLDLSELNDSMEELQEASDQLKDGTRELKEGSGQLRDGTGELLAGTGELWNGTAELKDGTQELADQSTLLDDGARTLDEGASALLNGTWELLNGTAALQDGVSELARGAGELQDGGAKLTEGTGNLVSGAKELDAGAGALAQGLTKASAGAQDLQKGIHALSEQVNRLCQLYGVPIQTGQHTDAARDTVDTCLAQLETQRDQAQAQAAQAQEAYRSAESTLAAACEPDTQSLEVVSAQETQIISEEAQMEVPVSATTVTRTITRTITSEPAQTQEGDGGDLQVSESVEETVEEATDSWTETVYKTVEMEVPVYSTETVNVETVNADQVQSALADCRQAGDQLSACEAAVQSYEEQIDTLQALSAALASDEAVRTQTQAQQQAELMANLQALQQALTQLSAGIDALAGEQGLKALNTGAGQLKNGTSSAVSGAQELNSGANALKQGIDTLNDGAGRLEDGAGSLKDGVSQLNSGTEELKTGTAQLRDGTGQLVEGTGTLNDGAGRLKDGVNTLKDGVLELDEGMGNLDEGALALVDGMFTFDEEGISRLTGLFGDDVQDVVDRLKAVSDAGKDYNTFTRLPEGMDGSVKFIIRTEGVK